MEVGQPCQSAVHPCPEDVLNIKVIIDDGAKLKFHKPCIIKNNAPNLWNSLTLNLIQLYFKVDVNGYLGVEGFVG